MQQTKVALDLQSIKERLQAIELPTVDRVVGIASGGLAPATIVAYELERPLTIISINYRNPDNTPRYDEPRVLSSVQLPEPNQRILLVDDVSVSGKTLSLAKELLKNHEIITLVMKGKSADFILFPEIAECVLWPWRMP